MRAAQRLRPAGPTVECLADEAAGLQLLDGAARHRTVASPGPRRPERLPDLHEPLIDHPEPGVARNESLTRLPDPGGSLQALLAKQAHRRPSPADDAGLCSVRDKNRSYADPSLTPIRAALRRRRRRGRLIGESAGRRTRPRSRTYGAVKATSAARRRLDGQEADVGVAPGHRLERLPGGAEADKLHRDAQPRRQLAGDVHGHPAGATDAPCARTGLPRLITLSTNRSGRGPPRPSQSRESLPPP